MKSLHLVPGKLPLDAVFSFYENAGSTIELDVSAKSAIDASSRLLEANLQQHQIVYGVNTGFGKFVSEVIPDEKLLTLQENLIFSHAVGVGPLLSEKIVRSIYLLKINALAQGFSGVRYALIEKLIQMYNGGIIPCVPAKGSVGASGDLAPLAHFSLPLLGKGEVYFQGKPTPTDIVFQKKKIDAFKLMPKEGLAMINGLQVSLAIALENLLFCNYLFHAALCAGALTTIAGRGRMDMFDERLTGVLHSSSVLVVAKTLHQLMGKADQSHRRQDPYSLRCQPQVMGPCFDHLSHVKQILAEAVNAVTDNPIVSANDKAIYYGGNFHGQNIALASDVLALLIATMGNISERRIAFLMDPQFSHLPAFLVSEGGVNSGLMILQVTAAALASENKRLSHPASVDTIPTSNNQEDHVSMATASAFRLGDMLENAMNIVAIELIVACQALDLQEKITLSSALQTCYDIVRKEVSFYDKDRSLSSEIAKVKEAIKKGAFKAPLNSLEKRS